MHPNKNGEPPNRQQPQDDRRNERMINANHHGLPAHLRRTLFPPPPVYPGHPNPNPNMDFTQPPPNYRPPSFHPPPVELYGASDTFSLCYTLSEDNNSLARQIFDQFRAHPLIPNHMIPRHIVFVYEKPDHRLHPRNPGRNVCTKDAGVGEHSVVRYDVETQTDESLTGVSRADKKKVLRKPLIADTDSNEPTTSNLSDSEMPEFSEAVLKVAKWLHMSKSLEGVFNSMPLPAGNRERSLTQSSSSQVVPYQPPMQSNVKSVSFKQDCAKISTENKGTDVGTTIVVKSDSGLPAKEKETTSGSEMSVKAIVGDAEVNGSGASETAAEKCSESPKKPDTETASLREEEPKEDDKKNESESTANSSSCDAEDEDEESSE